MPLETGDIIYWSGSTFGHIGMAYDANTVIHAQMSGDFHKEPDRQISADGGYTYKVDGALCKTFRPPWDRLGDAAARKTEIKAIADRISLTAKYGAYRAIRLFAGDSTFGPKAFARLQKYRDRWKGLDKSVKGGQIVSTVTCSEAVIVCYQLAFPLQESPFFIKLDASHAMPATLAGWLRTAQWAER